MKKNSKNNYIVEIKRIYIKNIEFSDALKFSEWGNFETPLLKGYNYGNFTSFDARIWINSVNSLRKKYFAVYEKKEDNFIGFIGLKSIKVFKKTSKLGIVFSPQYVGKGYGNEAIEGFLKYYFNELGFVEMTLDVNTFNQRALNLYKKLGFEIVGEDIEVFENQNIELDPSNFEEINSVIYSKIYKMVLKREDKIES